MNIQQTITCFSLCLMALCTLATTPTFAQTVTHVPLFTFDSGDSTSDLFGWSVSGAGDVNGDGFSDLIVGARDDNFGGVDNGSARVLSGVDGSILYNFYGDSSYDRFGWSVSGAGDVNADGFDDFIVGARNNRSGASRGSARVFSGIDGSILYNFVGDSPDDLFGESVSGAGDVNGDGFADFIVGAWGDDNNGSRSGSARVFSGIDGSVLYNFDGESANELFGYSVSGAGDVNGDGFADLIVGALRDDRNNQTGIARVFSGADGSVLYDFDSGSFVDGFGNAVSGAGDINGDGFDDFIVGARFDDANGEDSGSAKVFSGVDGSVLYNFEGSAGEIFGASVDGAGDVNGDGVADLIVGDPFSTTAGHGNARVFSGVDGSVLYSFDGDGAVGIFGNDYYGFSVSGAGDVNGDGLADFIVGAALGNYVRVFVSKIITLGDCNLDGVVTFSDIAPFIAILQSGTFLAEADCNQDGVVDFADIPALIAILQAG